MAVNGNNDLRRQAAIGSPGEWYFTQSVANVVASELDADIAGADVSQSAPSKIVFSDGRKYEGGEVRGEVQGTPPPDAA